MAKFKIIVSDPETGKSTAVEVEGSRAAPLIGRKIGETFDGSVVGLSGHKVVVTGGSDIAGFPMRPDVHGGVKLRVLLSGGVGYRRGDKGSRRRKMIRGDTVTEDIAQVNVKIIEKPKKKPEEAEKRQKKSERVRKPKGSKAAKPA